MYNRVMLVVHSMVTASFSAGAAAAIWAGYVEGVILILFALKSAGDAVSVYREWRSG